MLDGRFRFEGFVTGPSNRVAESAARAVADAPGKVYHPLFLYGDRGLGKTHLLGAIGFQAQQLDRRLKVRYRSAKEFVEQLGSALARHDIDAWRREFDSIRLLLIDDVQSLAGQAKAQEELMRLLDQAPGRGAQVVLASDRPPGDLEAIDQRLVSRMSGGLIVDIAPTEFETRLGILWLWRNVGVAELDDAVLDELARVNVQNVRELLVLFNKLVSRQSGTPESPATSVARIVNSEPHSVRAPTRAPERLREPERAPTPKPAPVPERATAPAPKPETAPTTKPAPVPVSVPNSVPNSVSVPVPGPVPARVPAPERKPAPAPDEFASFLDEVTAVVSSSVEQWRARLASTVARWAGEGYVTDSLQVMLDGSEPPDVDAVEAQFAAAVNQLRDLEQEAARLDPRLSGVSVFRDPAKLNEARSIVMRALAAYDPPPAPAHHLTIAGFAAGARNQLALRAAGEVIALPGSRYNPLFVHGAQSSGKTHLAHAIANALVNRDGGVWTIAVVDSAAMGEEIVEASRSGTMDRWRMRYYAADALVIDNVHRAGGSEHLQDAIFQFVNTFIETGRQVILTADAAPALVPAIAPRLRSCFEAGLVVEIGRVSEAEMVARHTPVPDGDEAAAPTIDAWFDDVTEPDTVPVGLLNSSGIDSFFLDPEKVVMDWPGLDGRVVEDPR